MKLRYIFMFFDSLMLFLATFLLFFCFFNSMNLYMKLSAIFSVILGVLVFILYIRLTLSQGYKKQQKTKQSKNIALFSQMLMGLSDEKLNEFFITNLMGGKNCKIVNNQIVFGDYVIVYLFLPEQITANQICLYLKQKNYDKKIIIFGVSFDKNAIIFCNKFNILTYSSDEIYKLISKSNTDFLPQNTQKRHFNILNLGFKSNYKRSLIFGISLIILSFYSFFPLYYQIFGSIFTIYGIVIAFFGKISPQSQIPLSDILA